MIIVFGDLLVDLSLRLEHFPLRAGEMQKSPFVELGPGGAGKGRGCSCCRPGQDKEKGPG